MIKPIGKLILVRKKETGNVKTQSGIILASENEKDAGIYQIIEVGEELNEDQQIVNIIKDDKHILIDEYEAKKAIYSAEEYMIITKEDILGIVE